MTHVPRKKEKITFAHASPAAVEQAAAQLGANIATARLRRRWPQAALARRAGITRATLGAIEKGKLGTGIGAYVSVLWALGMEQDIASVAAPERDREGVALEAARLGERARPPADLSDDF